MGVNPKCGDPFKIFISHPYHIFCCLETSISHETVDRMTVLPAHPFSVKYHVIQARLFGGGESRDSNVSPYQLPITDGVGVKEAAPCHLPVACHMCRMHEHEIWCDGPIGCKVTLHDCTCGKPFKLS
jgi:hypothetical protein